jgi:hypothetical protein
VVNGNQAISAQLAPEREVEFVVVEYGLKPEWR